MTVENVSGGFAPTDLTDSRTPGNWETRYPEKKAKKQIILEAVYLSLLLFMAPSMICLWWIGLLPNSLNLSNSESLVASQYWYVWMAGTLGGTIMSLKWLYHCVAKQSWNSDRWLWRVFSPHLSGALAFSMFAVMASGLLGVFDTTALGKPSFAIAIGFLVGYFSDSAAAKLSELAETIFGSTASKKSKQIDERKRE